MKKKEILFLKACALSLSLSLTNPLVTEAREYDKDKLLNNTISEYDGEELEPGKTVYESSAKPKVNYSISNVCDTVKIGDLALVNGQGTETCTGEGRKTINFQNTLMAVVGIKSHSEYPYALCTYENGVLGDVVGWFKKDAFQTGTITETKKSEADTVKEVIGATQVGIELIYDENGLPSSMVPEMGIPSYYEWLGTDYGVRTFYEIPEDYFVEKAVFQNYDNYDENADTIDYEVSGNDKVSYTFDYADGYLYRYENIGTSIRQNTKVLKKYNIKNN